jgi:hypothetical protein
MQLSTFVVLAAAATISARTLVVRDPSTTIEYVGLADEELEMFLGIPYGQDTSGTNRFKPPRLYVPAPGEKIDATKRGPACPQPLGQLSPPLALVNITEVSEDCLNLNIARPKLDDTGPLPVMVWIHGGTLKSELYHKQTLISEQVVASGMDPKTSQQQRQLACSDNQSRMDCQSCTSPSTTV